MSYSMLRRLFFCASIILCFSNGDAKSEAIVIPSSVALKPMPTEMIEAYVPDYVSSRADRWSEARSLISFSLRRIRARLLSMTRDLNEPALENDLQHLEKVFGDLRGDAIAAQIFLHPIESLKPEDSIPSLFTQIHFAFAPSSGGNEIRILYFDVGVLNHYSRDPDYWDGEILRGLISSYLPASEFAHRLRAAYWTVVKTPSKTRAAETGLAQYARVLRGETAFAEDYFESLPDERHEVRSLQSEDESIRGEWQVFHARSMSPLSLGRALFSAQGGFTDAEALELQKLWSFSIRNLREIMARMLKNERLRAQFGGREIQSILEEMNDRVFWSDEALRAVRMPDWARGHDLALEEELLFAEQRNPNVFYVDPAWIQAYWKSPLYFEGEILRLFAMLTGRTEGQAFQLRAIFWGQFPEMLWDERVQFSQSLYEGTPHNVAPATWNYYAGARAGYRREDFRKFLREAEEVLFSGSRAELLSFLRENFIEGMDEHTRKLRDSTLNASDLFAVVEQGTLQVDTSRQILAHAGSFLGRFDDPHEIKQLLAEMERLSNNWDQMVQITADLQTLKSNHLLPERFYEMETSITRLRRVRELFADFVKKAFGGCEDAANLAPPLNS